MVLVKSCTAGSTSARIGAVYARGLGDIVYALLGIASDCQNEDILVDYLKPILEIYKVIRLSKGKKLEGISIAPKGSWQKG
jgi:hypothetical protein